MKRLIIIVEGDTEKEFINKILTPYFHKHGIYSISSYKISKTGGGLTNYEHLKRDLLKAINEENVLVTTLLDFYALPVNFPKYAIAKGIADKQEKVGFLEKAIIEDIQGEEYIPHLLPYIQLHEFEAFVFTHINGFQKYFSDKEADFKKLNQTIDFFKNPEDINDSMETAPSKRLKKLIPSYNKVVDGNNIIEFNGIEAVIDKCPRFRKWTQEIIDKIIR